MSRLNADEIAAERLIAGTWNHQRDGRPHPDDIAAALQQLVARGASTAAIAARLGTHDRQILRWKADLAAGRELLLGRTGRTRRAA